MQTSVQIYLPHLRIQATGISILFHYIKDRSYTCLTEQLGNFQFISCNTVLHYPIPQKGPTCCSAADVALQAFLFSPPVPWKGWWLPFLGKRSYVKPKKRSYAKPRKASLLYQIAISGKQQKQFLEVYLRHNSGIAWSFLPIFLTVKNTHTCNYIFLDCIAKFMR